MVSVQALPPPHARCPPRARRSPGSSWQAQVARLQPAWHQSGAWQTPQGSKEYRLGILRNARRRTVTRWPGLLKGRAGSQGEVQELRFFCALYSLLW